MLKNRKGAIGVTVAWVCFALIGCGDPGDADMFQKAEALYREGRFDEAIPVLKSFLLRHPSHSGAHLYLGGCYQFSDQWSALAEGEIKTALLYYHRDGNRSTIARFDDAYFELRCYLDLIKIQFARLDFALAPKAPPEILAPILSDFQHSVAEA
ncbi:MAG: tetratricopeptide repeat protein, partial [FCB group bacterium]|nr:tetratricopeptide repeat protein [FCB group bacterium]